MQPTYTREAEEYREKVQAFLAEKLPADWHGLGRLEGDDDPHVRDRMAQDVARGRLPRARLAGRVRRRRSVGARAGDHRRGVRRGGCPDRRSQRRVRDPDARQHAAAARHRRAEGALPPAHPLRRRHLVSGLQRAQRRIRPRQHRPAGRARRRPVGAERSEDLDLGRAPRRSHLHARPHRSRRAQAQGHLVPPGRHASAGDRGAPDQDDLRRERVQRDLLHRRGRPQGRRRGRGQQRLGGGDDAARLRARRGGGHDAHPLPVRARTADAAGQRARARPAIRSSASGWRGATRRSRSCGTTACGR